MNNREGHYGRAIVAAVNAIEPALARIEALERERDEARDLAADAYDKQAIDESFAEIGAALGQGDEEDLADAARRCRRERDEALARNREALEILADATGEFAPAYLVASARKVRAVVSALREQLANRGTDGAPRVDQRDALQAQLRKAQEEIGSIRDALGGWGLNRTLIEAVAMVVGALNGHERRDGERAASVAPTIYDEIAALRAEIGRALAERDRLRALVPQTAEAIALVEWAHGPCHSCGGGPGGHFEGCGGCRCPACEKEWTALHAVCGEPHTGFDRNASHDAGRYVCTGEGKHDTIDATVRNICVSLRRSPGEVVITATRGPKYHKAIFELNEIAPLCKALDMMHEQLDTPTAPVPMPTRDELGIIAQRAAIDYADSAAVFDSYEQWCRAAEAVARELAKHAYCQICGRTLDGYRPPESA